MRVPDVLDTEPEATRKPNRAERRAAAKQETRFRTPLRRRGRVLQWKPTQVPEPKRIAERRRRNRAARASRKLNR